MGRSPKILPPISNFLTQNISYIEYIIRSEIDLKKQAPEFLVDITKNERV